MKNKVNYNINWGESFQLDKGSPSGLVRIMNGFGNKITPKIAGTKLYQSENPIGWVVRYKRRLYYVHRILWVLEHGSIDESLVIDHLDGNPFNNLISNLSLKYQKDNLKNRRKRTDNKSGINGICIVCRSGNYSYVVKWSDSSGKNLSKYFSVNKLGDELAKSSAIEFREEQMQKLSLEGVIYTDRHGK